mgnify:CR=1 FL=1
MLSSDNIKNDVAFCNVAFDWLMQQCSSKRKKSINKNGLCSQKEYLN